MVGVQRRDVGPDARLGQGAGIDRDALAQQGQAAVVEHAEGVGRVRLDAPHMTGLEGEGGQIGDGAAVGPQRLQGLGVGRIVQGAAQGLAAHDGGRAADTQHGDGLLHRVHLRPQPEHGGAGQAEHRPGQGAVPSDQARQFTGPGILVPQQQIQTQQDFRHGRDAHPAGQHGLDEAFVLLIGGHGRSRITSPG
jgi:hypothetical protein